MKQHLKLAALLAAVLALGASPIKSVIAADGYSFKVTNTTQEKITKLLASEDGKDYGDFDLGTDGIAPGKTVTLKWDKKTDDSGCDWFFKAVFEDGEESEAQAFDFCEEDLELEF